jgi:hypothetical protein
MQLIYKRMIYHREIIPEKTVLDSINGNIINMWNLRSMTQTTCQGRITAVDAERIDLALPSPDKMLHTVMHGVEESLPVERTALEYDGELKHGISN